MTTKMLWDYIMCLRRAFYLQEGSSDLVEMFLFHERANNSGLSVVLVKLRIIA